MSKAAASSADTKASHWDNRVAVAYLRMMGATQRGAAEGAGVSLRTVQTYEKHPSYPEAREEARERWCKNVSDLARTRLINSLKKKGDKDDSGEGQGDASPELALKIVERIDPELAPPRVRSEISGPGGSPIKVTEVEHDYTEGEE